MLATLHINWLAVLASAAIYMGLGALWYSPLLFGRIWMKAMGLTAEDIAAKQAGMSKAYAGMAVAALALSLAVAVVMDYAQALNAPEGAQIGLFLGLGIILTTQVGASIFEGRSPVVFGLSAAYQTVALALMCALQAVWY